MCCGFGSTSTESLKEVLPSRPSNGLLKSPKPWFFDGVMAAQSLLELQREEVLYLEPEKLVSVLESPARMAHDVLGLLKIITAISEIRGLIALERPLLELILDVLPAERGAIILTENTRSPLPPVLAWDRTQDPVPLRICEQISARVLRETVALLSNDVRDPREMIERSVMAVPLV